VETIAQLGDVDHWMVSLDPDGPLWYRGLAEAPDAPDAPSADAITAMLSRLGVQYMVVGHTPQDSGAITPAFGGRVFLLDTGMLPSVYDGRATALEIRSGRFTALSSDRAPEALPAPQAQ
jgi:hypothetical protein